jgi:hypothetical protein
MQEPSSPIQAVAFDQTIAASPPAPIRVSFPTPLESSPHTNGKSEENPNSSPKILDGVEEQTADSQEESSRRLRPVRPLSINGKGRTALLSDDQSSRSLKSPRSIPSIVIDDTVSRPSSRWSERRWGVLKGRKSIESDLRSQPAPPVEAPFHGITLNIPTGGLDEFTMDGMQFSKRGSLLNEKQSEAPPTPSTSNESPAAITTGSPRKRISNSLRVRQSAYTTRAISADDDMLSRRVRLMYERGEENVSDADVSRAIAQENGILWEEPTPTESRTDAVSDINGSTADLRSVSSVGTRSAIKREAQELAGGVEDWQNLEAGDVDRYGFIIPRPPTKDSQDPCVDAHPMQRVSTSLLIASETPRRKHAIIRSPSTVKSSRSLAGKSPTRNRKLSESSNRPSSSQSAYNPSLRRSPSKFRYATNRLPHNKDRRFRDEAADMLTLPFEVPEANEDTGVTMAMKKKEWEREDKWMKMAKPTKKSQDGSGMTFEFDTTSSKLIERTWKGIPDSWRATAWYAFLDASAKKRKDSPSADELTQAYHGFQDVSSPDDVQIDLDVPRTISSHVMFRRRYRGGQRLLFRVLHAMSLYFPDTGYVQGMAALAATLLAYYDEEHAFIMLVRLWQLRGLGHLYKAGFEGLMEALNDFERDWLERGEVAGKLVCNLSMTFLNLHYDADPSIVRMN